MSNFESEIKNNLKRIGSISILAGLILSNALPVRAETTSGDVRSREDKTNNLITNIDLYNVNDKKLTEDAAKAHYNMGNIYFEKGLYEIAVRQYFQAVSLMPDDPDAHFNLAFVSGEYLEDFKTALKHYKLYLYLNPDASDKKFVNEKIVQAQLALRSSVNSVLEEEKNK
ncbi:MAG: tetratricopeptide repeat protein [Candidatus Omnitrophica bacterium]|nr:tetratricopeptide repeat protein [Candidatus Omnitrophota bacterium]